MASSYRRSPAGGGGRSARSRMGEGGAAAETEAPAPSGMTMLDAMSIVTTVLLIAAILMMDKVLGVQFGTGMFFAP